MLPKLRPRLMILSPWLAAMKLQMHRSSRVHMKAGRQPAPPAPMPAIIPIITAGVWVVVNIPIRIIIVGVITARGAGHIPTSAAAGQYRHARGGQQAQKNFRHELSEMWSHGFQAQAAASFAQWGEKLQPRNRRICANFPPPPSQE